MPNVDCFRRNAPGFVAVFACKYIVYTVSSEAVRQVDDPAEVCRVWDEITHDFWHFVGHRKHTLLGTVPREVFVQDVETELGYAAVCETRQKSYPSKDGLLL